MKQLFLKIASLVYGAVVRVRKFLFDAGVLSSTEYDIPIICVGNITVGGTGKTPAVEMLVRHFYKTYSVAVLSRGYGRRTKGYREVEITDSYLDVGDEPLQIKRKFPSVRVVVCEKRTFGIERMRSLHPDINMIIMDDGFQHRSVKPFLNIIMLDATRPIQNDHFLPYGQLRDTAESLYRAHYFLVTKCPVDMKASDRMVTTSVLDQKPYQELYFTRPVISGIHPVFDGVDVRLPKPGDRVIAMSGIGNNEVFTEGLKARYDVVDVLNFEDHHSYRVGDLKRMTASLKKNPDAVIITTEKDAVKLFNSTKIPDDTRRRMFYESIEMTFFGKHGADEFIASIENELNKRNNGTYIRGC